MSYYQVAVTEQKKQSKFDKIAIVAIASMLPVFAYADGISTIGESLNGEVTASKAVILALFGIGATVLALFAGYRYMKRGANSA